MKGFVRWLPLLALLVCALPGTARAEVRLGLGADYWAPRVGRGLMNLTLTVDGHLSRYIHVGGRFGALATTTPTEFGVPIDLSVRATVGSGRVYLEGLVGPWILFTDSPLRFHAGFGFGLQTNSLTFGLEVGWLDPSPMAGLRLGFRI